MPQISEGILFFLRFPGSVPCPGKNSMYIKMSIGGMTLIGEKNWKLTWMIYIQKLSPYLTGLIKLINSKVHSEKGRSWKLPLLVLRNNKLSGCALVQVVRRRPLTTETGVVDKLALGQVSLRVLLFSPVSINPSMLRTHLFVCHRPIWTQRQQRR
jgi:hypothetical protein